jgi:hypothetical protein
VVRCPPLRRPGKVHRRQLVGPESRQYESRPQSAREEARRQRSVAAEIVDRSARGRAAWVVRPPCLGRDPLHQVYTPSTDGGRRRHGGPEDGDRSAAFQRASFKPFSSSRWLSRVGTPSKGLSSASLQACGDDPSPPPTPTRCRGDAIGSATNPGFRPSSSTTRFHGPSARPRCSSRAPPLEALEVNRGRWSAEQEAEAAEAKAKQDQAAPTASTSPSPSHPSPAVTSARRPPAHELETLIQDLQNSVKAEQARVLRLEALVHDALDEANRVNKQFNRTEADKKAGMAETDRLRRQLQNVQGVGVRGSPTGAWQARRRLHGG